MDSVLDGPMPERELTLDEMLSDVIVQLLMRSDGVSEDEVRRSMSTLRRGPAPHERDRPVNGSQLDPF
jgi:hypothetical protein